MSRVHLSIRIGLFVGLVLPKKNDFYGSGVNQAARVQAKAAPEEVLVNKDLFENFGRVWGKERAERYFTSKGKVALKNIINPAKQELFSFNWRLYSKENTAFGLANIVYEHFQNASVEASNLSISDLNNAGTIIWPVVPRDLATAIHRGQTEIIKLLTLLGWRITLLVADCGAQVYERPYSDSFRAALDQYLIARGLCNLETQFMSDLYNPSFKGYKQVQSIFRRVSSDLSLEDLLAINNKTYEAAIQEKIKNGPTLDFLRPAITVAAVLYLAEQAGQKVIVVAGQDERIQWERTFRMPRTRPHLGVLMNPVLKMDERHQGRQKRDWPIWDSIDSLILAMKSSGNLPWWIFKLHAFLPAFPASVANVGDHQVSPVEWQDDLQIPDKVVPEMLAREVWKLLDPAI